MIPTSENHIDLSKNVGYCKWQFYFKTWWSTMTCWVNKYIDFVLFCQTHPYHIIGYIYEVIHYWKWQLIVDFPIKKWWFSIAMLNYQRVSHQNRYPQEIPEILLGSTWTIATGRSWETQSWGWEGSSRGGGGHRFSRPCWRWWKSTGGLWPHHCIHCDI